MSTAELARRENNRPPLLPEAVEQVVVSGDLSKLSAAERVRYYEATCQSLGLNPLTRPFAYLQLSGKLTLYATRDCADQLGKLHQVSLSVVTRDRIEDVYLVHARATTPDGRSVEDLGAVALGNKRGDDLANALMKAQTKAYRRATLRICGLGWLDETELETIRDAQPMPDADEQSASCEVAANDQDLVCAQGYLDRVGAAESLDALRSLRAACQADATAKALSQELRTQVRRAFERRLKELDGSDMPF